MPAKYLESKLLIFSTDLTRLLSLLSGTKVRIPFCINLLSFKKKKEMKSTENRPMLKLLKTLTIELMKLGMNFRSSPLSTFSSILDSSSILFTLRVDAPK